jgi:ribose/xylose/arabinose/galactoside ABC-type transport system permease subunit
VVVALLLKSGAPPLLAALGGVLAGAACGMLIGGLITRLRLTPFIVTLGMWGAVRGLAKGLANEQMVFVPETWLNRLLSTVRDGEGWMLLPPGVWLTLLLAVLTIAVLRYTRFGRHVYAIGSNEQTARLCGVRVEQTKVLIYTLGGAFAGIAGILQFSYLTLGDPTTAMGLELDVIAAVVIGGGSLSGGEGSVPGSIIGALIMTVVANGCTKLGLANWIQEIVTGLIIVLAVTVDRLRQRKSE